MSQGSAFFVLNSLYLISIRSHLVEIVKKSPSFGHKSVKTTLSLEFISKIDFIFDCAFEYRMQFQKLQWYP